MEHLIVILYALVIVLVIIPYWLFKLVETINEENEKKKLDEGGEQE